MAPKRLPCDVCPSQARYTVKAARSRTVSRSCGRHLTGFVDTISVSFGPRASRRRVPVTITVLGA